MKKFLIIRLSSMGDIIHALPAFAALRANFPQAKIHWLVEDKGKDILDLVPGIDKIIVVSSKKWGLASKKFWSDLVRVVREIRDRDQIALDFQGLIKSGLFAFLSKARTRIGYSRENLREAGASIFYTENLDPISETMHVIDKNLKLLTRIGIQSESFKFPIQIPEVLSSRVMDSIRVLGYRENNPLVVLNVGAAWETKRWFSGRWIELIRILKAKSPNSFFLLLWGTDIEKNLAEDIASETEVALTPELTLTEVMALVQETDLIISGDTFALQVACAFSRPAVGLFGPTTPKRNGPFREQDKVAFHEMECSHCYKRRCSSLECLKKITPQEVAEMSLEILNSHE